MFEKKAKTSSIQSNDNNNATSFFSLPAEAIFLIGSFLDKKSLGRTSRLGRWPYAVLKAPLAQVKAEQLLKLAMDGNPKGLARLLKMSHSDSECIVLKQVRGVEKCGRSSESISPLEYAAWAGDTEIVRLLLKAVPEMERIKAIEQLQNVQEKGTVHGSHMSAYVSLIEAYDEYIAKFDNWNKTKCDYYWVHEIGKKQFMLPLVGLQQMCDKGAFHPLPSFQHAPERSLILANGSSLLPLSSSGLGVTCSLIKGGHVKPWPVDGWESGWPPQVAFDCDAFRRLCEVRKKELSDIIDQLKKPSVEMETNKSTHRCVIS